LRSRGPGVAAEIERQEGTRDGQIRIVPEQGDNATPKPGRPHSGRWVAYYRVSTDRQGDSGLGLDAQRKLVSDYLNGGKWVLSAEFTEVESGQRSDRPQLATALVMCRKLKAKLIVANLSQLSRNVSSFLR
jgi:Resolvase, N terminal domain